MQKYFKIVSQPSSNIFLYILCITLFEAAFRALNSPDIWFLTVTFHNSGIVQPLPVAPQMEVNESP